MYRKPITISNGLIAHVDRMVKDVSKLMNIKKPNRVYLFKYDFIKFTDNKISYEDYIKIKHNDPKVHLLKGCHDTLNHNLFINIKDHISIDEIDETILHELIHIKEPELNHGIKFNSLIEYYELKLRSNCDHLFNKGIQFRSIKSSKGFESQNYNNKCIDSFICLKCNMFLRYNKRLIKSLIISKENKDKPFSSFNKEYKLNKEVLLN